MTRFGVVVFLFVCFCYPQLMPGRCLRELLNSMEKNTLRKHYFWPLESLKKIAKRYCTCTIMKLAISSLNLFSLFFQLTKKLQYSTIHYLQRTLQIPSSAHANLVLACQLQIILFCLCRVMPTTVIHAVYVYSNTLSSNKNRFFCSTIKCKMLCLKDRTNHNICFASSKNCLLRDGPPGLNSLSLKWLSSYNHVLSSYPRPSCSKPGYSNPRSSQSFSANLFPNTRQIFHQNARILIFRAG